MPKLRIALIGCGRFGANHRRILQAHPEVDLVGVADPDPAAQATVADYHELLGKMDAAIVAAPSSLHAAIGAELLEANVDVLMEKPLAEDLAGARDLVAKAHEKNRILATGHLERFNPAVIALEERVNMPLFFEVHRLSAFSPRSLDIDVVLDLMIHDVEILLRLTGARPKEIHAAGISVVTEKVDIANVRMEWESGCIANLTASRVSTEQVRKLRLFQPHQYYSLDYAKRELFSIEVGENLQPRFGPIAVPKADPLETEIADFVHACLHRHPARVTGEDGLAALEVAAEILDKIGKHLDRVAATLRAAGRPIT